jgi:hypothetical protein
MHELKKSKATLRPRVTKAPVKAKDPNHDLKLGIWIYFLLLIFEGGLRKWVLPALSTPLLLVRDPIALWLLIMSARRGLLVTNIYMSGMIALGITGIFTAVIFGHGNFPVAVYGARILALHFPLIFVIGCIFNRDDVVQIGKVTMIISIPMALLIAMQFYSPQSAWVNQAVGGGDEGAGFSGTVDYFRPPGTFSFTNGTTLFFGFLAPFVFYFWFNPKGVNKILLIGATLCLLSSIPLSISRALFFQIIITMIFAVIAISRKPQYIGKLIVVSIAGLFSLIVLSQASFFKTATGAFNERLTGANESEGGVKGVLGDRYLGGMIKGITGSADQPFWGQGIGIGTSVGGSMLLGKAGLQLGEDEWQRTIGEMGILLGLAVICIRLGICIKIAKVAYRRLTVGDLLPWLLLSFLLVNVPQGQWGQPTSLGFGIVIGGLAMASLRVKVNRNMKQGKPLKREALPVSDIAATEAV